MKKKILVVEDETHLSLAMQKTLTGKGFEVQMAFDGEQAMKYLKEFTPDLVLLDILMPKVSGLEFLEQARALKDEKISKVPVFILTNYPEGHYKEKAKELGVEKFIIKSEVDISFIVHSVESFFS